MGQLSQLSVKLNTSENFATLTTPLLTALPMTATQITKHNTTKRQFQLNFAARTDTHLTRV